VTGQLQHVGDDGPLRCSLCGAEAVGPCARCRSPVCGDCCVLTEGGAKLWAICLRCEKKGGKSLAGGWGLVLAWIALPLVALALITVLLELAFR
jgi:hypothetical protein